MLVKVTAVQTQLGHKLTLDECLLIFKQRPDFVCFPEYYLIGPEEIDFAGPALQIKENLEYLESLSIAFSTCVIGGSVVESDGDYLYNSAYLYYKGDYVGKYRKLNPVAGEIDKGILPGDRFFTVAIDGVKIALLICADALNIDIFKSLLRENVDIIFIPTTSPLKPDESPHHKFKRDSEIFVRAAQESSSYIVKTCGIGSLFDKPLQGRSLIASPWGVIKRVEPHREAAECILTSVLDIDEIRDFRQKKRIIAEELADIVTGED